MKYLIGVIFTTAVLLLLGGHHLTEEIVYVKIKNKEVKPLNKEGGETVYQIYTTILEPIDSVENEYVLGDKTEVFTNSDDWTYFKWNSSDVYGELEKDSIYRIKVTGFRIQFLSKYRNIVVLYKN
tara:strand:+ start:1377 stop:1751 length:375 start_codon:yes stop_codon:yes gene_type:complete